MQNFEYASPATLQEALGLLGSQWGEADVLAGGTDLISLMKDYVQSPKRVVNIKGIKELGGIKKTSAGLRIGATVTLDELASNALVRAEYPSLITAALGVTSPQTRNTGTVGGDLCQRPRCWYFRQGFGLFAKEVENGENRYHAIFGGPARFVSASSFGPALACLGAKVKLVSSKGPRELPVEQFFVSPRDGNSREIALQPNEILTEIIVPASRGAKNATYEIRQRELMDWPLATASVVLRMKGSSVESASICMGHVASTPWRASAAEKLLAGKSLSPDVCEQAGAAAVQDAQPLSGNGYKVQLAKVAVKRALMAAGGLKA